jgi:hypothetical protein
MITPIASPQLTGKWVAGFLFVLLSVGLEYVPGFSTWWEGVEEKTKKGVIAAAGLLVMAAVIGLHYAGAFSLDAPQDGWAVAGEALNAWLAMLGGDWALWSLLKHAAESGRVWGLPRKRNV